MLFTLPLRRMLLPASRAEESGRTEREDGREGSTRAAASGAMVEQRRVFDPGSKSAELRGREGGGKRVEEKGSAPGHAHDAS